MRGKSACHFRCFTMASHLSASATVWCGSLADVPYFSQGSVEDWSDKEAHVPKRKQDKGYEKWLEGFIHEIQVKDCGDTCIIKALSFRSMAKNENAYHVQVELLKTDGLQVQSSSCGCKAGHARCSHLVALLYSIAHFKKLGMKAIPPVISKTSQPQQWHVPCRRLGIHPQSVDKMFVSKVKPQSAKSRKRKCTTEGILPTLYCPIQPQIPWQDISRSWATRVKVAKPDCQMLRLLPECSHLTVATSIFGPVPAGSILACQQPPEDTGDIIFDHSVPEFPCLVDGMQTRYFQCALTKAEQDVMQSLEFDKETCLEIEKKTTEQSKTSIWKSVRAKRLTASIFHRVVVRRKDEDKLSEMLLSVKHIQTKAMKHGIEQEAEAAKIYATATGRNVYKCGLVVNMNAPHLGASPDRKVFDAATNPPFGLLEIKCPVDDSFSSTACLKQEADGSHKLKRNHAYYHQVMGQMAITGLSWCDFFVMCKNDYHLERIHFKADLWEDMKRKLDSFFFSYHLPRLARQ